MRTEYRYINFVETSVLGTGRTTQIFGCRNKRSGDPLGTVQWYRAWRQYCFEPFAGTVLSAGCLVDIQDFIRQLMEEHAHGTKQGRVAPV